MRRALILMLLAVSLIPAEAAQESALLVFYRPKRYTGSALTPSVYLDRNQIARLDNGRYFSLYVEPGKHQISSSMKESPLELEVNSGQTVYLEMVILTGTWRGGGRLIPAPAEEATNAIARLKPLDKKWVLDAKVVFDVQQNPSTVPRQQVNEPQPNPIANPPSQPQSNAGAELIITSIPDGAEISLDGDFIGSTPSTIAVPSGDHAITIKKSGYKDWERRIKISNGEVRISAELEPEPRQN